MKLGRLAEHVPSHLRRRRIDDSGAKENETEMLVPANYILLMVLAFNRLKKRLALSPNGPQSAPIPQGSDATYEHKTGNQDENKGPIKSGEYRFESKSNMGTIPAFGVFDIDRTWSNGFP
jgi:hypothetical protein